jgi:hypothetical protein
MDGWVGWWVCMLFAEKFFVENNFHLGRRRKSEGEGKKFFRQNFFRRRGTQFFLLQMIFGEKFISAKVESAKIVFGEIHFRRKWNRRNSSSAKFPFGESGIGENRLRRKKFSAKMD